MVRLLEQIGLLAKRWATYQRVRAELETYTERELNDMGMSRADIGRIAPGQFADVVIYDPATVADNATFDYSHHFSSGIEITLINGRVAWERGAATGALPGRVLRKNR